MSAMAHYEIPEHVQRIIHREDEIEFTPPSFERWLGRLQMLRTLSSMGAFLLVWLVTYGGGQGWEDATLRGIIAALVFHFFAWAAGLFIFGELYDIEVKTARANLEERERDRAQRIEAYYRERLRAQGLLDNDPDEGSSSVISDLDNNAPAGSVTPLPAPGRAAGTQPHQSDQRAA